MCGYKVPIYLHACDTTSVSICTITYCTSAQCITYVCLFYRALLYIGHGVSEYMGRYEKLANHLSDNGILVFGLDYGNVCVCVCVCVYDDYMCALKTCTQKYCKMFKMLLLHTKYGTILHRTTEKILVLHCTLYTCILGMRLGKN